MMESIGSLTSAAMLDYSSFQFFWGSSLGY